MNPRRRPGTDEPRGYGSRSLATTLVFAGLLALVCVRAGQNRLAVEVLAVTPGALVGFSLGRFVVRSGVRGAYLVGAFVLACAVCWGLSSAIPGGLGRWWGVVYWYFVIGFLAYLGGEVLRGLIVRISTPEEKPNWRQMPLVQLLLLAGRRRPPMQLLLLGGVLLVFVIMFVASHH